MEAENTIPKTRPKRLRLIWQIIIFLILIVAIPIGMLVLRNNLDTRSRALITDVPKEIIISNLTDTNATVTFHTPNSPTNSIVLFGTTDLDQTSIDETNTSGAGTKIHFHKLSNLSPDTTYKYSITIGDKNYVSDSFTFKTFKTSTTNPPTPQPINGKLIGSNFSEGIVYVHLTDGQINSSVVSSSLLPDTGAYTADISNVKDADGQPFIQTHPDYKTVVFTNAADKGKGYVLAEKGIQLIDDITLNNSTAEYNPSSLQYNSGDPILPLPSETEQSPTPIQTNIPSPLTPTNVASPTPSTPAQAQVSELNLILSPFSADGQDSRMPVNARICNPSTTSFTLVWQTHLPTVGSVVFGTNANNLTKQALDIRDSGSGGTRRYTHSIDILESTMSTSNPLYFKIISDKFEITDNDKVFRYTPPATLASPPSPTNQNGSIKVNFTHSTSSRDFLITGQLDSASTCISSVASESNSWNLPLGNALKTNLSEYAFSPTSQLTIQAYGEYNSISEAELVPSDTPVEIVFEEPGLAVTNLLPEDTIPPLTSVAGLASFNGLVQVQLGSISNSINSTAQGEWSYVIPANITQPDQTFVFQSEGTTLYIPVTIEIDDLPATNILDLTPYIISSLLIAFGLTLNHWIKHERKRQRSLLR